MYEYIWRIANTGALWQGYIWLRHCTRNCPTLWGCLGLRSCGYLLKHWRRLSGPEPIYHYRTFLLQTCFPKNAIRPTLNQSLGRSEANLFPERDTVIHFFAMTWGPPVTKFTHIGMSESIPQSVCVIVGEKCFFMSSTFLESKQYFQETTSSVTKNFLSRTWGVIFLQI